MELVTVVGNIINAAALLLGALLGAWATQRLWSATPGQLNQTAYEMAYRGTLHNLAGRHIKSRQQAGNGTAWLREAAYLHKQSSRAGRDDATDDIKDAVIASTTTIGPAIRCDANFLERQISAKLQSRMGNRPATQSQQTLDDALQSAALYQQIMQRHMQRQRRWQKWLLI